MKITIVGTGYVGLVTSACFASRGNFVTCLDIDNEKINSLNKNVIPIYEPGLKDKIELALNHGTINFTTDYETAIANSTIVFICVGTPMKENGDTNLDYVFESAKLIGKYLSNESIIITKSTVPIGTTFRVKDIIKKTIDDRKENILFDVANNPEFLKQGRAVDDFNSPDRIIVGIENEKSKEVFKELYKPFSTNHEKLIFMDILSSELTKYAANAMLATKISFINEMSIIAEKVGADIKMVRKGIGSDSRIGFSFIYPSIGYGGSCFPKDISSIINVSKDFDYEPKILKSVKLVNENQKFYFLDKIKSRFPDLKKSCKQFAIWGLSFKPRTDDMRGSAAIYIIEELVKLGCKLKVYDPEAMENAKRKYFKNLSNIFYCKDKYEALDGSDALILLTEWPEFRSPDFEIINKKLSQPVIFDGRNQYSDNYLKNIGFEYLRIGKKND
ncbi:MAG: UDP-glucose 6-dehydrogenase [Candidatus Marinimicrobia bacterium]|nr:UDP-glucose 6-dehydrogenase [Candidatus Neomarinimicrobiota bacterium]|tara:strand:- start:2689 stop:4023 length:1335 start_codon:yes stop_codon:yes gene_type:complete